MSREGRWHICFDYKGKPFTSVSAYSERVAKRVAVELHRIARDDIEKVTIQEEQGWEEGMQRSMAGGKWQPR